MALSAAGIQARGSAAAVTLDPAVEAVLAWTVREGATNVIRHSHADRCSLKVTAGLGEAGVEVVDDGRGSDPGLARSQRRVRPRDRGSARARAAAYMAGSRPGARPEGGFRLAVNVPVPAR